MSGLDRLRVGVIGAGVLAGIRAEAVAGSGLADVVAIAARRPESAERLASGFPRAAPISTDGPLAMSDLDAVIVALPHWLQDAVVPRALNRGLDVLIGGPLARTSAVGREIRQRQHETGLVVEAGYEGRYERLWRRAGELIADGAIGDVVSVRSNAGFDQVTDRWYVDQELSGGMLVTHLTYAFLNPLRWLLGDPRVRGAVGNVKKVRTPGAVDPETCIALVEFPGNVAGALTASYVKPAGFNDWNVVLVGTTGALVLYPADLGGGRLELTRPGREVLTETSDGDGFTRQADAFLHAVAARRAGEPSIGDELLNPPSSALRDLELCDEIQQALDRR